MALTKCIECGKEISSEAEICPNCGFRLKEEKIQNVVVQKTNTSRTGTILCIEGASLLIGFAILVVISLMMPSTTREKEETRKSDMTINVTIGEETEINQQLVIVYLVGIGVVSIEIITLGILYLKNKISKVTLYGIVMLILSIILGVMLIVTLSFCCFVILYIAPILCFIGSIMILSGNVREKRNEIQTNY